MMYDHEFKGASIEKVTWRQIRERVARVNPEFCAVVDDIDPPDSEPLYLAKYPYGVVIDDGVFKFPNLETGEILPLSSEKIHPNLKRDFSYAGSSTPIGMVMDKTFELYVVNGQISPWDIYKKGSFIALKGRLDLDKSFYPIHLLHMSSGVRSAYILPNIGDRISMKNLQRSLKRKVLMPNGISDQWNLFRTLYNNAGSENENGKKWKSSLLLFPNVWFEKIKNEKSHSDLHLFLYKQAWKTTEFDRNQRFFNRAYSLAQKNRNLKPNPYLVDIAKHVFMVMAAGIPGFKVAIDDESAPISFLKKIFLEEHGLRGYYPHFFVPEYFDFFSESRPVYASLQIPTFLEFSPKARKESSTLSNLWELKHIVTNFKEEMLLGNSGVDETSMINLLKNTSIEFFHNQNDYRGEINKSADLVFKDESFNEKKLGNKIFAASGPFLRGCVQISKN